MKENQLQKEQENGKNKKTILSVREICIFAMFGALMFVSKIAFSALPNIHPVGMLLLCCTLVYRKKALIPLYLFVFLDGIYNGFSLWWAPYIYVWLPLWIAGMLLPRNMGKVQGMILCPCVCALHGLAFGTLFAPGYALCMGLSFKAMLAWIAAGFPWDITHAIGNLVIGTLAFPLSVLTRKLSEGRIR